MSVILFGLTEIGLVTNNQIAIVNAACNGARVASLNAGSQSLVNTAVSDAAGSPPDCTMATPTVSGSATTGWTVTASCTYTPITPLAPLFQLFGSTTTSTYTISASATMKDSTCVYPTCQ